MGNSPGNQVSQGNGAALAGGWTWERVPSGCEIAKKILVDLKMWLLGERGWDHFAVPGHWNLGLGLSGLMGPFLKGNTRLFTLGASRIR